MNYAELVTQIQDLTENEEQSFIDNIPNFVRRAEERIYRHVKMPKLRKVVTNIAFADGIREVTLPDDLLTIDFFSVVSTGVHYYLLAKEADFLREAYPAITTEGRPVYYAMLDNNTVVVAPTPDAAYTTEMAYMHKPTSIVDDGESWVGDNYENGLLYATLVEAHIYMLSDEGLITLYNNRFMEAVGLGKEIDTVRARTDEYRNAPQVS